MPDTNRPIRENHGNLDWAGLREIDRAIAQDQLTAYRWKKAWADPINRIVMIVVVALLAAFVGYVLLSDLVIGH